MQPNEPKRPINILRRPQVEAKTGYSTSTLEMMSRGAFPRPIPLGPTRSVGWIEAEVEAHLEALVRQRDAAWQSLGDAARRVVGNLKVSG
jgi:prophage regulatory protein